MTQSISDVLVFLLWFQLNVILVAFWVEVLGNWSVQSLLLPLLNVLEVVLLVIRSVRYESVFVWENKLLIGHVLTLETQVLKLCFHWSILINVGINTANTVLIWPV